MKPFITPDKTSTGKKSFPYQCEGFECDALWRHLEGQRLVAYVLPDGHGLTAVWGLSLVFYSGLILEFSSACTQAVDWKEVGSLNVKLTRDSKEGVATMIAERKGIAVPLVELANAEKLIYEDEDVVVECGLVLHGSDGQQVVIAAGIPPGSVSVHASFSVGQPFEPQFSLATCRRQTL